jgi:hypothetical protein
MHSNATPDGTSAIHPAWLQAQTQRASSLTQQTAQRLGLSAADAARVAQGQGMQLGRYVCSLTLVPLPGATPDSACPMLVTLATGRALAGLSPQEQRAQFALAPMLALGQACIGCTPEGELCLFRLVQAHEMSVDGLAAATAHALHMAQLVWDEQAAPARGA